MKRAYISVGSNLGDRRGYLKEALRLLHDQEGIRLGQVSSCYETEPVDYMDQGKFFNAVFSLETVHSPHVLLNVLQDVESRLERERAIRWGPRTVDLDILLYNDLVLKNQVLNIPHPRMLERAFVLVPLAEIASSVVHPVTAKAVWQHLEELENRSGVVRLEAESRYLAGVVKRQR